MAEHEPAVPHDVGSQRLIENVKRSQFGRLSRSSGGPLAALQTAIGVVFLAAVLFFIVRVAF